MMKYERFTCNPNNIDFCSPCYLCKHKDEMPKRNKYKCSPIECDYLKCYEKLAELEDKIENGTLIELPCKVGTVLYEVISKCKTGGLDCPYNGGYSTSRCKNGCGAYIAEQKFTFLSMRELIGKTLFLTREEAEARLKELQE